jgi:hydrogenase expression/formation protein HypD
MRREGRSAITNAYGRAVTEEGNPRARSVMAGVFHPQDSVWRGLGTIPGSGLGLRPGLAHRDALALIPAEEIARMPDRADDEEGCRCGEILSGAALPPDCPLYGDVCTPVHPVGPCMVSGEGTCAAYYKYGEGRPR